ncbi:MAG TPA: metalloprotease TldD [Nevskiaceae bacterium]|nr:metalloprotease TldD [Nevskiaceae bacterium]
MTTAETASPLRASERNLLEPASLDVDRVNRVLSGLMKPGIDAADLYFQGTQFESWMLEDGIIKTGSHDAGRGVGVRVCSGEKSGFAYSDEISLPALESSSRAVAAIARQGQQAQVRAFESPHPNALYAPVNPLGGWTTEEKLSILRRVDVAARAADPRVKQVIATLAGSFETVLVAAADGTLAADLRPLVRLSVNVIAEHNGRREQASSGAGGRGPYARFFDGDAPERLAKEAVRQVGVALEADPAPAGSMTVVLGPGWPGVLLHEAIGHGLEGDFNRKGTSAFTGRIGEKVANELCTVVDDGTLPNRRGSLTLDDEGTPTQCTTLIEKGILKGYIQDKLNARLMGVKPTGNGRRESYAHLPMPRMTNTYMLPGPHEREEIIASVKRGLYAVNFAGGQVDITSGNFVFSASEAYLIEDGKITRPVKGATLIGNGPEVLNRVTMVGKDLEIDPGIGVCGKDGQSVPVGVGQPTLKIEGLTVGGTQSA